VSKTAIKLPLSSLPEATPDFGTRRPDSFANSTQLNPIELSMGYTDAMDEQTRCGCGWTGPRATLRDGRCPSCKRLAGMPYAYPPYASWARPMAKSPTSFVTPISPIEFPRGSWRDYASARPRWLFATTLVASFVAVMVLLHGGHSLKHKHRKQPQRQVENQVKQRKNIECIMPLPPGHVVDPYKRANPPLKYGPPPHVTPVPTAPVAPGAKYGAYSPAPLPPKVPGAERK